jgi:stage III sporulation protein AH
MVVINLKGLKRPRTIVAIVLAVGVICAMLYIRPTLFTKKDYNRALSVAKPVVPVSQEVSMPVAAMDFFIEYRVERDRLRSERVDLLREVSKNTKSDDGARQKAQDAIIKITLDRQKEMEMENLIKARGFNDAIVVLRENSVSAIIKTTTLSKDEVMQIADVIARSAGVRPEDITISTKL